MNGRHALLSGRGRRKQTKCFPERCASLTEVLELSDFMSFFLGGCVLQRKQSQNLNDLLEALQIFLPFQMMWHGPYTHTQIHQYFKHLTSEIYFVFFCQGAGVIFSTLLVRANQPFFKGGFSKVKWSQTVHSTSFHLFFFQTQWAPLRYH